MSLARLSGGLSATNFCAALRERNQTDQVQINPADKSVVIAERRGFFASGKFGFVPFGEDEGVDGVVAADVRRRSGIIC